MEYRVIIDIHNCHYEEEKDMRGLLNYVVSDKKNKNKRIKYYGSRGVSKNPEKALKQLVHIQKMHGKDNKRRLYQIIVSFEEKQPIDNHITKIIAEQLANKCFKRYQVLYGVHDDTDNLHIHFVLNAVSYIDGKKIQIGKRDLERIKREWCEVINKVLEDYGIEKVYF